MLNELITWVRPTNTRSAILSSCLSLAASKLAASSAAKVSLLMTSLMTLPHNQAANVVTQALMSLMLPIHVVNAPVKAVSKQIAKKPISNIIIVKKSNRLNLRSLEKDYTCRFTGKVTCGDRPCNSADLRVHINSKKLNDLTKTVSIGADGVYNVRFDLKANQNDHLDWWIVADSPDSASKQVQGRQILMEDVTVTIEEPIHLL